MKPESSSIIDSQHFKGVETFRSYSAGEDPGFYSGPLYASSNWNSRVVDEHSGHKKVLFIDVSSPTNYWESFNFASAGTGVIEMYAMIADVNAPIVFKISNMRDNNALMAELFWYTNIEKWEQRASWDTTPDIVATQVYISDYEWFIPKFAYSSTNGGTWTFSVTYGPNLENTVILSSVTNVDVLLGDVVQISVSNAWSSGADTWIDSISYTWSIDIPYSEGDLLNVDITSDPLIPNEFLSLIGLPLLAVAVGLILIIYFKSHKTREKITNFKEKRHQNSVLKFEKRNRKREATGRFKDIKVEKLREIFQNSNKMRIEDVAEMIELDQSEFLKILVENRHVLGNITIEGDYIMVSPGEDMDAFISMLDAQFQSWDSKQKSNEGKK